MVAFIFPQPVACSLFVGVLFVIISEVSSSFDNTLPF